jgi:hypothetical protein
MASNRKLPPRKLRCLTLKVGYPSRDEAMFASFGLLPHANSILLRLYLCEQCAQWHLTSQPPLHNGGKWNGIERIVEAR